MANKDEFELQKQIVTYIKLQYPDTIVISTLNGIKLSIGQAVQAASLQCGRGIPDALILEARRGFHGLCGEIKLNAAGVYKRNGDFKNQHVAEQAAMLNLLRERGYYAAFLCGFDEAKEIIDWYLGDDK